jgi:hypothetical protein
VRNQLKVMRRVLLVYPRFTRTCLFGYRHLAKLLPGKRAVMPSLGLITFGAVLSRDEWRVRLVDENVGCMRRARRISAADELPAFLTLSSGLVSGRDGAAAAR